MDAAANHVVIVGGPEAEDELLAIVLDESEEAVPLFDSVEEAEEFLDSIGEFGEDWRAREVSAQELIALLEYQGEEVEYVALSPHQREWRAEWRSSSSTARSSSTSCAARQLPNHARRRRVSGAGCSAARARERRTSCSVAT